MNFQKILKPFRRRVWMESILKAFLLSGIFSALSVFIISLVYHLRLKETAVSATVSAGLLVFVLTFAVCLILRRPTGKKVAGRMDELGLKERVSTMLEYQDSGEDMARLQRSDALKKIGEISPEQIRFRFRKRELILLGVSILLAAVMLLLPYDIFSFGISAEAGSEEQEEYIKNLIADLRQEVRDAELEDELKKQLDQVIDELEEDLKNADSELEQAAEIEQAKREMSELLESSLTRNQIGEALQRFELTRKLGEAVSDGDTEKVSSSLNDLKTLLKEDKTLVSELAKVLDAALEKSGVDPSDELYSAIGSFSEDLSVIDPESGDADAAIDAAFSSAEKEILAALEKQNAIEAAQEKLEGEMDAAKDEALGNDKEEPPEGEDGESRDENESMEPPDGAEMPEDQPQEEQSMPEDMPEGSGQIQGSGETQGSLMTEGIYDPVSGNTSYGEVFAAYYAEYLAALEEGEVPEELQEILDRYYASLNR